MLNVPKWYYYICCGTTTLMHKVMQADSTCRFEYLMELQEGRVFDSAHELPFSEDARSPRTRNRADTRKPGTETTFQSDEDMVAAELFRYVRRHRVAGWREEQVGAMDRSLGETAVDQRSNSSALTGGGESDMWQLPADADKMFLYNLAFSKWVDSAMSLLLEIGNMMLHQIDVLMLVLYHTGTAVILEVRVSVFFFEHNKASVDCFDTIFWGETLSWK